jgi:L-lactate dehydrogenase complex protein LldG
MSKSSKENILKRLNTASSKTPIPYPEIVDEKDIFSPAPEDLLKLFKEQFTALGGTCYFCNSKEELIQAILPHCENVAKDAMYCADENLIHLLRNAGFSGLNESLDIVAEGSLCISSCIGLLARTGSILFSSAQTEGRSHAIAPDTQIIIAFKQQLHYNINEVVEAYLSTCSSLPSMVSLTSGASRTADIEKTLVMGAHGPKELIVVMLDA